MRNYIALLFAILAVGCQTPYHTSYFYFPSKTNLISISSRGFHYQKPDSWVSWSSSVFDDSSNRPGEMLSVRAYEWSPIIHFNTLTNSVRWQDDLPRMDAEIIRRSRLQDIQTSEELTHYNKFTGHGVRKVGKSDNLRFEYILFYPEGEMTGTRIIIILCGSPNNASLREMDEIIHSVYYIPNS